MIVKYTKFNKLNEDKSPDYYSMFEFDGGGFRFAVDFGWVGIRLNDKSYQFDIEEGDDFFEVYLDGEEEQQNELEELGVKFKSESNEVECEDFKNFIYDMYQEASQ